MSSVIELNRAVAVAMSGRPESGLKIIEAILGRGDLVSYSLAHSARGELLRRVGRTPDAIEAIEKAFALTEQASEKRFLAEKLRELRAS